MKIYRLNFEYISPFTGEWVARYREDVNLASLQEQLAGQLTMPDVRGSLISESEIVTSEWKPIEAVVKGTE